MRTMAGTLFALALVGCAGQQSNHWAETPIAKTPHVYYEAPPANVADVDRDALIQQFNDMHDTRQAYEEAAEPAAQVAPPSTPQGTPATSGPPGTVQPQKIGPAVEAPMPPKKK